MLVIVFGPRRGSRPNGGCAAPKAMNTLPIEDACGGIRRPTQSAARVRALHLGEAGDAGRRRDRDVGGLARLLLESLQEREGERGEVADGRVAAGVVDEHRARPEAAARLALGQAVPLERAQEPGGGGLGQPRLLHHPAERQHVVALDQPDQDPRGAVDRLRALFEWRHRCHIVAPDVLDVKPGR